jgi:hypothetical protein
LEQISEGRSCFRDVAAFAFPFMPKSPPVFQCRSRHDDFGRRVADDRGHSVADLRRNEGDEVVPKFSHFF